MVTIGCWFPASSDQVATAVVTVEDDGASADLVAVSMKDGLNLFRYFPAIALASSSVVVH